MTDAKVTAEKFGWELDYLTDGSPIFQCKKYYTFTSDSVLLAKYVDDKEINTLVDFCSGSGIVGLEVVGRVKTNNLIQFEIQKELSEMCAYTNKYNKTNTKIILYNNSLTKAREQINNVDVVVCNPPYFKLGSGRVNEDKSRMIARHEVEVTLVQILEEAHKILKSEGNLYLIHIEDRYNELLRLIKKIPFEVEKEEHLQTSKLKRFLIKLRKKIE